MIAGRLLLLVFLVLPTLASAAKVESFPARGSIEWARIHMKGIQGNISGKPSRRGLNDFRDMFEVVFTHHGAEHPRDLASDLVAGKWNPSHQELHLSLHELVRDFLDWHQTTFPSTSLKSRLSEHRTSLEQALSDKTTASIAQHLLDFLDGKSSLTERTTATYAYNFFRFGKPGLAQSTFVSEHTRQQLLQRRTILEENLTNLDTRPAAKHLLDFLDGSSSLAEGTIARYANNFLRLGKPGLAQAQFVSKETLRRLLLRRTILERALIDPETRLIARHLLDFLDGSSSLAEGTIAQYANNFLRLGKPGLATSQFVSDEARRQLISKRSILEEASSDPATRLIAQHLLDFLDGNSSLAEATLTDYANNFLRLGKPGLAQSTFVSEQTRQQLLLRRPILEEAQTNPDTQFIAQRLLDFLDDKSSLGEATLAIYAHNFIRFGKPGLANSRLVSQQTWQQLLLRRPILEEALTDPDKQLVAQHLLDFLDGKSSLSEGTIVHYANQLLRLGKPGLAQSQFVSEEARRRLLQQRPVLEEASTDLDTQIIAQHLLDFLDGTSSLSEATLVPYANNFLRRGKSGLAHSKFVSEETRRQLISKRPVLEEASTDPDTQLIAQHLLDFLDRKSSLAEATIVLYAYNFLGRGKPGLAHSRFVSEEARRQLILKRPILEEASTNPDTRLIAQHLLDFLDRKSSLAEGTIVLYANNFLRFGKPGLAHSKFVAEEAP